MTVAPFVLAAAVLAAPAARVTVDLTGAPRQLIHTTLAIPATPGPMTLAYPKWLPGEHGPTGPIKDVAGFFVKAGGKELAWSRDPKDMFRFRVEVPAGVSELQVDFDVLSTVSTEGFSSGASVTAKLAILNWNQVIVYPAGTKGNDISFEASLKLPPGWSIGTALPIASSSATLTRFTPVSMTTLVDSPVLAGEHLRTVVLDDKPGGRVLLDMAADNPAALAIAPELERGYKNLVTEADRLFGARHFKDYHFLLSLSDQIAHFGLEHHASSDDRARERALIDDDTRAVSMNLLPHEYVHSWNGKFRRPADLNPDDFQSPVDSSLLWVYEGLTQYLGWVLAGRSGLRTPAAELDDLALRTAALDASSGREWRPLVDTAVAAQLLYETPDAWTAWRRSVDFYDEGTLIWLEADVTIRRLTKGAKSLDDFCKRFHGGGSGLPEVKTYTFDDVVAALEATAPNDWAAFLRERVTRRGKGAPLGGIDGGGWRLTFAAQPSPQLKSREEVEATLDVRYSVGLLLDKAGVVIDVLPGSAAWNAGISPGMKLIGVDGLRYSRSRLRDAIASSKARPGKVGVILENGESFLQTSLEASGGERYPILERVSQAPDVIGAILAPKAGSAYNDPATPQRR